MSGVNDIRSSFLDYFAKAGHEVVPSSPLVPRNDPTLMFTNAGMVQFKNVFTGLEKRPYSRAVTAQKCVRAGGKHNDLDNVGYTARHHTFFEMLGNFSFGDYFKDRAIELAWNLVTKEFGLPKDRLTGHRLCRRRRGLRSVEEDRRPAGQQDHPHRRLRQFLGDGRHRPVRPVLGNLLRPRRPHPRRPARLARTPTATASSRSGTSCSCSSSSCRAASASTCRGPRSTPAWGSSASPRCCRARTTITTSTCSRALIRAIAELTGVDPTAPQKASHRVIADHLRASAFLIADGVLPSNEGRGYVLRRIMRRAMRHAELLGAREPLMWKLVPALMREMGQAYPELRPRRGADHRDAEARGDALPQDAGARPCDPRRGDARRSSRATCSTARPRSRSTTPTAFRSISRRTRCAPRGIGVDLDGLQRGDGAPARQGARLLGGLGRGRDRDRLVRAAREARRHRIPRLRDRDRRRRGRRAGARRQGSRRAEGRRERRGGRQPDAVLRRIRRPGRRHRRDDGATACASRVTDTQKKAGDLFVHHRHGRAGRAQGRRWRWRSRSITRAAPRSGATIRRRICCTRRCARCSAITSRRRARWSRPTGCASTSRIPSR